MTIDIPAFTIPEPIFWVLAITLICFVVGEQIISRFVLRRLAHREGDILATSRYLPLSILVGGPFTWVLAVKDQRNLRRFWREGRGRRARRAQRAQAA